MQVLINMIMDPTLHEQSMATSTIMKIILVKTFTNQYTLGKLSVDRLLTVTLKRPLPIQMAFLEAGHLLTKSISSLIVWALRL